MDWLQAMEQWIASSLGVVVVAPVILAWAGKSSLRMSVWRILEALICAAGLIGGCLLAFNLWLLPDLQFYPVLFLPFPFLVWGASRFGPRGAVTGTLILAALAMYSVMEKCGPFFAGSELNTLRILGTYVGIVAVTNLLLGSAAAQRGLARIELIENERRLRAVVADQMDLICRFDPAGRLTFVNAAFCRFHAKEEKELLATDFFLTLEEAEAGKLRASLQVLADGKSGAEF